MRNLIRLLILMSIFLAPHILKAEESKTLIEVWEDNDRILFAKHVRGCLGYFRQTTALNIEVKLEWDTSATLTNISFPKGDFYSQHDSAYKSDIKRIEALFQNCDKKLPIRPEIVELTKSFIFELNR